MSAYAELLAIKRFRESQAELRMIHSRVQLQAALETLAEAEALLKRLLQEGMDTELGLYRDLCARIVRLYEIEAVRQTVAWLRQREAAQQDVTSAAETSARIAEEALNQARKLHREATRQTEKFADLARDFDLTLAREFERREDLEMEEAASIRRDREEWDAFAEESV